MTETVMTETAMTETAEFTMQFSLKKQLQKWLFNRTSIISLIVLVPTHLCLAKISGYFPLPMAVAQFGLLAGYFWQP